MPNLEALEQLLVKRWVCEVVRSGYHNGAGCSPKDPHGEWNCCYRYEISLTQEQYDRLKAADLTG